LAEKEWKTKEKSKEMNKLMDKRNGGEPHHLGEGAPR